MVEEKRGKVLKHRLKKIEQRLLIKAKKVKLLDVKFGEPGEKQIADIVVGRVRHSDGSFFSENDKNVFIDFDMFLPKVLRPEKNEQN